MVDLSNKIETDLESKTPDILEENIDNNTQENNSSQDNLIDNKDELQVEENVSLDNVETSTETENQEVANCLALTVKKDYNLSIVKNVVVKTFKNAWKIALSIFTLNFLKFFL